jgi:hypothetical protein
MSIPGRPKPVKPEGACCYTVRACVTAAYALFETESEGPGSVPFSSRTISPSRM